MMTRPNFRGRTGYALVGWTGSESTGPTIEARLNRWLPGAAVAR